MRMSDSNNNYAATAVASPVQEFYSDSSVLVTGGTGFVGKALVEKLLRSCPGISHVFVLIRPKRGLDPESRLRELLKNSVFDRIRSENSGLLKKIVPVPGDLQENGLGLSENDRNRLQTDVTVVFHSAATVRFNEALKDAVNLNTCATQRVIEFCASIHNLKALVHVSTAYSNAEKRVVDEVVYKPPADPAGIIDFCQTFDEETVENLSDSLMECRKHPNTYTLTKAMAEWIVSDQADSFPTAIVRPSIVTAAWKEPMPGWVDNVSGITGIMMEIGRGTIRSIVCNDRLRVDIVPVDIVVNTLIAAAWHVYTHRSNTVRVYNCTTGSLNGIYWHELGNLTMKHALDVPSKYIQWYPGFSFRTNRVMHHIVHALFHYMPALCVDSILRLQGAKPMMLRICDKFKKAAKTGEFFALHEWEFRCDNQKSLSLNMSGRDQILFNSDVTPLVWDEYIRLYMVGIRKYVLQDSLDSLPAAKQKLQRFYYLHRCSQVVATYMLVKATGLR